MDPLLTPPPPNTSKTVFLTGVTGYIGHAVAVAFVRAGYRVYGLTRSSASIPALQAAEIHPVLGNLDDRDLTFLPPLLAQQARWDIIVSCTETLVDYPGHYDAILRLITRLAASHNAQPNVTAPPLVLYTSGCKDYGSQPLTANPDPGPGPYHTEESPLNPPRLLAPRAFTAPKILEPQHARSDDDDNKAAFHALLLRPTNVYGGGSSFYGLLFKLAEQAKADGLAVLRIPAPRRSVMHALHVDDCAEAYVALARVALEEAGGLERVTGQAFNISSYRWETAEEVGNALAKEYGFERVEFDESLLSTGQEEEAAKGVEPDILSYLFRFNQAVGSEKIRSVTGWRDRRALLSEDVGTYRRAWEGTKEIGGKVMDFSWLDTLRQA